MEWLNNLKFSLFSALPPNSHFEDKMATHVATVDEAMARATRIVQSLHGSEETFMGQMPVFWRQHIPILNHELICGALPEHLYSISKADPTILQGLALGYPVLIEKLDNWLHYKDLKTVADAEVCLADIADILKDVWPPAAVFASFYGKIVTVEVNKLNEEVFFEAPEFMGRLPAQFARLYLEAVYEFLTNPLKLKKERPAWYIALGYALQGHPWVAVHGSVGIIAHIMADLALGISDTLLDIHREKLISQYPSLVDNQNFSFFVDDLLNPKNQEAVEWLEKCERDHYKIGPILEDLTPPTLDQFKTWWGDPITALVHTIESVSSSVLGKGANGLLTLNFIFPPIHAERSISWSDALRFLASMSTDGCKITFNGEERLLSHATIQLGTNYRSAVRAIALTGGSVVSDVSELRIFS